MASPEEQKKADDEREAKLQKQEKLDGSPALVERNYVRLKFQLGPVKDYGINGVQTDDVIDILLDRMRGFNRGPFACRENAMVITKLEEAQHWLGHRTASRKRRGVEGKLSP